MNETRESELNQLLDMSQKMLGLADKNDWDDFTELENNRKKVMYSFFESPLIDESSAEDSEKIEQIIKKVLLINEQIEKKAQQNKCTLARQLQGMKKKQNVHSAYLQNK